MSAAAATAVASCEVAQVRRVVEWLNSDRREQQHQASLVLRSLAAHAANKQAIRDAGGIPPLVLLLDNGPESALTVVAAETLSCLVADDPVNRVRIATASDVENRRGFFDPSIRTAVRRSSDARALPFAVGNSRASGSLRHARGKRSVDRVAGPSAVRIRVL